MTLEEQIRQRWGQYGNWQSADQNQAADLARLFEANGITDLSKLSFKKREYEAPGQEWETEAGMVRTDPAKRTTFDVLYGDQNLGFLGDINRDGSLSKLAKDYIADGSGPQLTDRGDNGPILGWSSRGGGNTNFNLVENPQTGEIVVMPNWGSSKTQTYNDLLGIASILGLAAGAYYAPAGGAAGAAAQGGLQGYGLATGASLLGDGDVNSTVNAGLAGGVTGAVAGGVKGYGQSQGWNPATTRAVTGGANAALRGGSGEDILRGAAGGAISGGIGQLGQNYGWSPEATAAARGAAGAAVGGGDGRDILRGAATGYAGSAINNSARGNGYLSGQDGLQTEPGFFAPGGQGYDAGGGMDYFSSTFGDGSGYTENAFGDTFGNTPINAQDYWGFDPSIYDMGGGYDSQQGSGIDWGSLLSKGVDWLTQGGGKDGKGASPLAMLLGGLLGAQGGKDQQQTSSRDPWAPMQPYLLGLAEDGRKLYNQYTQQPFSPAQQTAYGNVGGLLDVLNLNAGGLLQGMQANATGQNQFVRGQPRQLIGSAPIDGMAFQPGLLGNFGTRRG